MTSLVAGTQFRGQFEQRVKGLISEIKAAGNIILFIDEIHSIVGAGDSDGSMNAANIMKPALADIVAESSTKYGARELRRTIRKTIEDPVSDALVDGRLDGREVTLELADHDGRAVLEI